MKRQNRALLALGALLLLADDACATVSGQIHVRLLIIAGCEVTKDVIDLTNPVAGSALLDFGEQGPTWTHPLKAGLGDAVDSKLEVSCNPSVTGFTVTIDGGAHGDGTTRRLSNGRQTIPYRLFLDAAGSDSYSIGQQRNFAVAQGVQVPIPVFGSVVVNTRAVPAGVYTDTLKVRLDW
ncbi:spore coat protein [Pseudomonas brassicacearum]|uniref:Spore coat protein n=1 Tax=Pseudomonas brassicacearum TaxID=930166 RepID=A0A423H493_9PSED|nr:spore coat U domain-containing protein [Pseudomonas brassicacearum]RON08027.1 spore coat protein [Pseudomonas brassicacearum]